MLQHCVSKVLEFSNRIITDLNVLQVVEVKMNSWLGFLTYSCPTHPTKDDTGAQGVSGIPGVPGVLPLQSLDNDNARWLIITFHYLSCYLTLISTCRQHRIFSYNLTFSPFFIFFIRASFFLFLLHSSHLLPISSEYNGSTKSVCTWRNLVGHSQDIGKG